MKRLMYLIGSCLVAMLLAIAVTAFLQENKGIAHAAQPAMGDGTWTVYTTAHGLPSDRVRGGVVIDDSGQVWAGFQKGSLSNPYNEILSRLDGNTWVNYFIPGCIVDPLFADDMVYAGSYCPGPHSNQGYGLHWFVDDAWVHFMPGDGMEGTYLRAIAAEGETKVWFSAGYTDICRHYVNLLDHKGTADKADDEWTVYDFSSNWGICSVNNIGIDLQGNRWFSTSDDIRVLTVDNNWISYSLGGGDFAFDEYGNVWSGYSNSVVKYNGSTWIQYNSREEAIESNFTEIMSSIDKDWVGGYYNLWAIEEPAGIWIYNLNQDVRFYDGQNWTIYTPDNSGLSSDDVKGIAVDNLGNIWIASDRSQNDGGLNKFTPFPDYSLQAAPNTIFLKQGQETTINITVRRLRGWVPTTTLSITGLPSSVSATFENNPVTPTAQVQLTLTSTKATPLGTYSLNLMTTTSDGLSRMVNLTLYIVEEVFYAYLPVMFKP